jgi:hypothetical protein
MVKLSVLTHELKMTERQRDTSCPEFKLMSKLRQKRDFLKNITGFFHNLVSGPLTGLVCVV